MPPVVYNTRLRLRLPPSGGTIGGVLFLQRNIMSLIGEILPSSHILRDLVVSSKKRLFEQAGLLLENEAGVARAEVFDCLFAREKLGSTGLGHGVAVPHGRLASLKRRSVSLSAVKSRFLLMRPTANPFHWLWYCWFPKMPQARIWKSYPNSQENFQTKACANS